MLYPLRHHAHGARVTRVTAAIFVFPSLIAALVAQIFIARDGLIFIAMARLPIVKLQFGFQLTEQNIPIIISVNLLMAVLIFTLSNRNLVNYCSIASLAALFIFILAATPDQIVRICAYSLGIVALSAVLIADEVNEEAIAVLSRDFIINRISDLLAFTALIHILLRFNFFVTNEIDTAAIDIELIYNLLFFASIILRLVSLSDTSKFAAPTATKLIIFYRLLIGVGAVLLFLFYSNPASQDAEQQRLFLAITIGLSVYAVAIGLFKRERFFSINNVVNLLLIATIYLILFNHKAIATGIICCIIIFYPAASLGFVHRLPENSAASLRLKLGALLYTSWSAIFAPLRKAAHLLASIFINAISIIYAGFLLYRLPQFVLACLQIPLRFLNNGSIQRSLFFVVIMLVAYSYWWGES